MGFQLPQMPDFSVKIPPPFDPLAQQQKQATLSGMLDENSLRRQLAPLQVQEQAEKAKALSLQNQTTQTQQNDMVAFGKMFLASEGDTNELMQMIADPKRNF